VARTSLPPFDVVSAGNGFQTFNPPVKGIALHLLEDFICFAYRVYDTKCDIMMQEVKS
jgi:hypothetical protein